MVYPKRSCRMYGRPKSSATREFISVLQDNSNRMKRQCDEEMVAIPDNAISKRAKFAFIIPSDHELQDSATWKLDNRAQVFDIEVAIDQMRDKKTKERCTKIGSHELNDTASFTTRPIQPLEHKPSQVVLTLPLIPELQNTNCAPSIVNEEHGAGNDKFHLNQEGAKPRSDDRQTQKQEIKIMHKIKNNHFTDYVSRSLLEQTITYSNFTRSNPAFSSTNPCISDRDLAAMSLLPVTDILPTLGPPPTPHKLQPYSASSAASHFDSTILTTLISYTLKLHQHIQPFYCFGHPIPFHDDFEKDQNLVANPNNDTSIFLVSRAFASLATALFYGKNRFSFDCPDACKWFLRRIGPMNINYLQDIVLEFDTGWVPHDRMQTKTGGDVLKLTHRPECQEELWYKVIKRYIIPYHNLKCIALRFAWQFFEVEYGINRQGCRSLPPQGVWPRSEERMKIWEARYALWNLFSDHMRGLETVKIEAKDANMITKSNIRCMAHCLKQDKDTAAEIDWYAGFQIKQTPNDLEGALAYARLQIQKRELGMNIGSNERRRR